MITTVTLNPAIDRTVVLDVFEYGAVNRVKNVREDIGGKGINVAKILKSLGQDVKAIGFLGSLNDTHVQKLLANEQLDTEFVYIPSNTRTNTKIVELSKSVTTDVNEAGFHVRENEINEISDLVKAYALKSDYIVLSGSVPQGASKMLYKELLEKIGDDAKVVLDAEGDLLMNSLSAKPYLIKPNIHELEGALGCTLSTDDEVIEAARGWIDLYGITYILVSMGGDGSLLVSKESVYKAMPMKVAVRSTVGAGDSMLAGFVHGLCTQTDGDVLSEALACGAACGTLAVSKEGTESFSKDEVSDMLSRIIVVKVK